MLLTVLNPVTLQRFPQKVGDPVTGSPTFRRSLRKLHVALSSVRDLERNADSERVASVDALAGFHLLTLNVEHTVRNVEHTVKIKVVALRQLLQWCDYPAPVFLQEVGGLLARFLFHCMACAGPRGSVPKAS